MLAELAKGFEKCSPGLLALVVAGFIESLQSRIDLTTQKKSILFHVFLPLA
jgi:hypothetical protein